MSRKYQYVAKKRGSNNYYEATSTCNRGVSGNFTTCRTCLIRAGRTHSLQQSSGISNSMNKK